MAPDWSMCVPRAGVVNCARPPRYLSQEYKMYCASHNSTPDPPLHFTGHLTWTSDMLLVACEPTRLESALCTRTLPQ
eukprot:scaffold277731_cov30-Tisochrysis_lutea.AAC.3